MIRLWGEKLRLPKRARVDACTLCQLDCRGCYMRKGNYCGVGAGHLSFENFAKFVEMNPFVEEVELSNNGEIFLNPELMKIIYYAHRKGVRLTAYGGTNFNDVSDDMLEALVKYGFQVLNIAIDGSSQETYAKYRRKGDFEKVIANVKRLNARKKEYGSDAPRLLWQYVVFDGNDSIEEIERAKKMAKDLDMCLAFHHDFHGYVPENVDAIEKATGISYRGPMSDRLNVWTPRRRWLPCFHLWEEPAVNWDGRFTGCCSGYNETFPMNAFELGLEKILRSRLVRETKKMLMGGGNLRSLPVQPLLDV